MAIRRIESIPSDLAENLNRIENVSRNELNTICMELTHAVYPHENVYGQYCTIEEYIECPAQFAFDYLANPENLQEWTYSMRHMEQTSDPQILKFVESIADNTFCYCKTISDENAMTVDYHCAWDQANDLWMIYLMRVIPAKKLLDKSGCVVLWTNCHHPNYDHNPYPETAPKDRDIWVGDVWDMFYAGHSIEMQNLKKILEYRHRRLTLE